LNRRCQLVGRARGAGVLMLAVLASTIHIHAAEVTAHVTLTVVDANKARLAHSNEGVVLWLTPVTNAPSGSAVDPSAHYQLIQKNKEFHPHLLVVPVGSTVEFPNLDPFFHNVFSFFNGRKFDLGLYESGTSRKVRFDREGVSYVFCNIHPEMSAVIVVVPTSHFAVSAPDGSVAIHGVEPGTYDVHLWAAGNSDKLTSAQVHRANIDGNTDLGVFTIETHLSGPHKNKFGEDYPAPHPQQY